MEGMEALIYSICQLSWCKYSLHDWLNLVVFHHWLQSWKEMLTVNPHELVSLFQHSTDMRTSSILLSPTNYTFNICHISCTSVTRIINSCPNESLCAQSCFPPPGQSDQANAILACCRWLPKIFRIKSFLLPAGLCIYWVLPVNTNSLPRIFFKHTELFPLWGLLFIISYA